MSAAQPELVDEKVDHDAARRVIRAFADELTGRGLDVGGPEWDRSQYLKITNVSGVLCDLAVRDDGAAWEIHVCGQADAARLAGMILALLGADGTPDSPVTRNHRNLTVRGAVGRALAEHGMRVALDILYTDDSAYEVCSAIVVTNPARPDRGQVQFADDNLIRWECRVGNPSRERPGISPTEIAEAIARALST